MSLTRTASSANRDGIAIGAILLALASACGEAVEDQRAGTGGAPPADSPAAQDSGAVVTPSDTSAGTDPRIGERAIGRIRIGLPESELRAGAAAARDTTWPMEGMEERGVIVPIGPGSATAHLVNGAVARIIIRDPALTTPAGLGVGATLGALRAAYGRECAAVGEVGLAVVWFAAFPGVSFALDQRPGESANEIQRDPSLLPDSANVVELWIHGQNVVC